MTGWGLVLCEGAHEVEFLSTLLAVSRSWNVEKGFYVPGSSPAPKSDRFRTLTDSGVPASKDPARHVLADLGGVDNVLGKRGEELLRNMGNSPACVAFVIDADSIGIGQRHQAVTELWKKAGLPEASTPRLGEVVVGKPGSGLWIAPDCSSEGTLDSLIVQAAEAVNADRVRVARQFIRDLAAVDEHSWGAYELKATAGAIGQRWLAGASLATALTKREGWMTPEIATAPPFAALIDFLVRVSGRL
ncbi:MAG: DUF3226 domain-containing protein [Planctomycetota bacterium]